MNTPTHRPPLKTIALGLLLLAAGAAFAATDTYLVIDLSGGTNAGSYPVSTLSDVPAGGWTDEHKTDKLVLRKIPAGTFTMGSPTDELGRYSDEPQHAVTLTKDFHIGVFEVTQRQWELVMGSRPSYFTNEAYYDSRPVEQVSYYDIRENPANSAISPSWPATNAVHAGSFMGKLRTKTGLAAFDLPTESQWEYACRAGTTTALNSGSNLTSTTTCPNMAAIGRYANNGGGGLGFMDHNCATNVATAAVGSYLPNAWGLHDMHGNVFELCLDWYGAYPGTATDPKGPTGPSDSYFTSRAGRGGFWGDNAAYCRSAKRRYDDTRPFVRNHAFGFRVACGLSDFDTDTDGLPDAWEIAHFGNLTASDGTGDFDGDGRTDAEELADNTDPTGPGSTLGLVAYYPFNGNADDASGNGNHGTAINTILATNRFGDAQQAFDFNGNAYVSVPSQPDLLFQNSFATVAWIKTTHTRGGVATQNSANSGGNYRLGIDNGGRFAFSTNPGETIYSALVNDDVWHQLVGVYDATTQSLLHYVDGIRVLSVDGIGPAGLNANMSLVIGDENAHNWKFIGLIDDVRIYNRALSSNEVARLYAATAPGADTEMVVIPDPVLVGEQLLKDGYSFPLGTYQAYNTSSNLAYGADCVVSGWHPWHGIHSPSFLTDGYYGNGASWTHDAPAAWLKIDLGRSCPVDRVDFGRDRLGYWDDREPGNYKIWVSETEGSFSDADTSNDSNEYTLVFDSAHHGFSGVILFNDTISARFSSVPARYIKIAFTTSGACVDEVEVFASSQPTTHRVTLHPGDHGDIPGVPSGADYVTNVTHGAAFTPPTPDADAGWNFTCWNLALPATITNDLVATARYAADPQTSRFQIVGGSFTWQEAKADAEARGGHLATFTSAEEWQRMLAEVGDLIGDRGVWLGGTDEIEDGLWRWVTGEAWVYTNWTPGDPNNHLGIEHYLMTWGAANSHRWADVLSSAIASYILEIPGTTPPPPRPDLSLSASDLRILGANGAQTANPAIGERVTVEVTVHNAGETNTSGTVLVELFLDGAPPDLARYSTNTFPVVASASFAESLAVGGSRILHIPWPVTRPARVATLTAVAESQANRTASEAGTALPNPETGYANNSVGRSIQIGSPAAGLYRIAVLPTLPTDMQSGVRYTLSGTAVYAWGSTSAVIGAQATVNVNGETYTDRTAPPNGAWSVLLNGLPAGDHLANVQVDDGGVIGATNLTLAVGSGPQTVSLRVKQLAFVSGVYRAEGETAYAVTGSNVVLKALVRNDGNAPTNGATVVFKDPAGTVIGTVPVTVPAFSEVWVTAPAGWSAQAGTHSLSAESAGSARVCAVVGTAALPDLVVAALTVEPGAPVEGLAATLTATLRNQGAAAVVAGTPLATLFSPGGEVVLTLPSDLLPDATVAVSTQHIFATAGGTSVNAAADSQGAVAELNELNNAATLALTVRQARPDLRPWYLRWGWQPVSGLSFAPPQPVAGEPVTVSCDLYNVGTVPLAAGREFNVAFGAGGSSFTTNRVILAADLAVGASVRVTTNWPGGAAGQATLTVAVDSLGEVEEENEVNNDTSAGLTVYPVNAELVAAGLSFAPLQPLPAAPVTITATVRNDGGAAGGAGERVEFFAGSTAPGDKIGEASLAGDVAAKGGARTVAFDWRTPVAPCNVTLYARIGASVAQRVLTVTEYPAPNLQVYSEDISVSPPWPESGDRVTVLANIRNTEGSTATNFHVRFGYDSPAGSWVDLGAPIFVGSLAAGSNRTVASGVAITAERSAYSVLVEILSNTVQGDANSNDNAATSSFLLAGTPSADAGGDVMGYVGQTLVFDGSGSTNATSYVWTLASAPTGSTAALTAANTITPSLVPDQPGLYELRLIVGNDGVPSEPDTVRLTVEWLTLTVASAHGAPVPGTGLHHFAWSASVDCQSMFVESVGLTQHVCLGWTGTGSVLPTNGTTTNVAFTVTNHSTLAWLWSTNYWLDVAVVGSGSVDVASGWVASGSNVVLTAAPAVGHRFARWSGDTAACAIVGAHIAAPMTGPRALTATFISDELIAMVAALLHENPDDQAAHGLYTLSSIRSLLASPLLIAVDPVTGTIRLDLQMQWRDDLSTGDWQTLGEPVRWSDTNTAGKAFYRVRLSEPLE